MNKDRLTEIELSRGICMGCVILIHSTSSSLVDISSHSALYPIFLLVNKLACFSVPAFLFLSGVVLFYKYADGWKRNQWLPFYLRRAKYVLIPYIIWAVIYYFFYYAVYGDYNSITFIGLMEQLALGKTFYHLYFAVLIIQYYLLTPILLSVAGAGRRNSMFVLGFAVLVQASMSFLSDTYFGLEDNSFLFTTYFASFVLGCWFGQYYENIMRRMESRKGALYGLCIGLTVLYSWVRLGDVYGRISLHPLLTELIVHSYCLSVAVSLLLISRSWSGPHGVTKLIKLAGVCSFGVYLIHPAVLILLEKLIAFFGPAAYPFGIVLIFIGTTAASVSLVYMLRLWKGSWVLVGR
ncbi:acyltransferase [Paenibacillus ginsengarvi]|uniref:Acyltransferase n=1 Tax=Paenibacillus ginsengarvi TaxID=400777 RepID=A0A3B0C391_9BACL|nr:acyltransferase [Paenibacillus ginsengarvi]RKN80615.1 acyltransferase [Paenibacillus ginsengarvi]